MPSEVTRYVGARIARLREREGLSQRDLAKLLGVSQATLANWELGRHEPDLSRLVALANTFQVPVWWFLPWRIGDLAWVEPLLAEMPSEDRRRLLAAIEQARRKLGE